MAKTFGLFLGPSNERSIFLSSLSNVSFLENFQLLPEAIPRPELLMPRKFAMRISANGSRNRASPTINAAVDDTFNIYVAEALCARRDEETVYASLSILVSLN